VNAQQGLIGTPATFVGLDVRHIAVTHELAKSRRGAQLLAPQLGIVAEHRMRENGSCQPSGLIERYDVGWPELELSIAAARVCIALIEGLAARVTHLKHETALIGVKEIDL
jgi:hypothetical protein